MNIGAVKPAVYAMACSTSHSDSQNIFPPIKKVLTLGIALQFSPFLGAGWL